jgi:uncharacterized protein (TIGR02466 family)
MFTPLFTDGVWNTTFNSDLKEYCYNIREKDNGVIKTNSAMGYHTNGLNLTDPEIQPLKSHIEQSVKNYSQFISVNCKHKVCDMWINISGHKDYLSEHIHARTLFSGVYYVHTPKNCGDIEFIRHSHDYMLYDWKDVQNKYNTYNSARWTLPAEKNRCYIFPSLMKHSVTPNMNQDDRIAISFNIV